jgi:hypothetical protein
MLTVLLAVLVFVAVMALISVGVILGKRTPLRGSCASVGHESHGPGEVCGACTCGAAAVSGPENGVPPGGAVGCGPVDGTSPPATGRSAK